MMSSSTRAAVDDDDSGGADLSYASTGVPARVGSGRRGRRDGDARCAAMNRPFGVCAVRSGVDALAFTDMHARSDSTRLCS